MGLRLLTLACLAGAAFAGPYPRESLDECARKCTPGSQKNFNWKVGTTNLYHFESENKVTYAGVQTESSAIEGVLEYQTVSPCHAVLKLRDLRISQKLTPEEKEDMTKKLEMEISIYQNDGKVEHVCPSPEESTQSLNFKKGIISSFVNHMSNLETQEETITSDSLGNCKTKYTPVKTKNGVIVKKEVDLESCSKKHMFITSIFPTTKIPSSLIFPKSSLECTQRIEDGIMQEVKCDEIEIMKPPMKDQKNWVELSGKLHIMSIGSKPSDPYMSTENRHKEELLYDIEGTRKGDSSVKEAEEILSKLCLKNDKVVDAGFSKSFLMFIEKAKSLSYEDLNRIYKSTRNGRICSSKKVQDLVVDALPMIRTKDSIQLMVELIIDGHITGLKEKLFPASLALVQRPTGEMIARMMPLFERDDSISVLLGMSAMIHKLCAREDCKYVKPANDVVSKLGNIIGKGCSSEDDDKTMSALKAFGNMGYHGDAQEDIVACIQDTSKSNAIRIAAIEAFKNMKEKRPEAFMKVYADKDEDSEIRIRCLASLWRVAGSEQFQKIKVIAESETDHQVGAYLSSLIENMKKSTSPAKEKRRRMLEEQEIQTPKFKRWGNSKNIEWHAFSKTFNVGGGLGSDVIYSNESVIPRSISTSLEAEMFNKSVDLLEIRMRAEGLEKLLNKMFDLKDSLPNKSFWDLISSKQLWSDTDTDVSFDFLVMGLNIGSFSGSDLTGFGEMIKIAEMMNKLAQGENADWSHSFIFLNSELVVPSMTGRFYSMQMTGTSTVGFTGRTLVDLLSYPQNSHINFQFQPSMSVVLSTTIGIQPNGKNSNVKISSNMHMKSNFEAKIHQKKGSYRANLVFPSEDIVKITMSNDIVHIDAGHNERPIYDEMQTKVDHCFTHFHKPLGISACTKIETPKPLMMKSFPYISPFIRGEFALKKYDVEMYEMRLEMPKKSDSHKTYSFMCNTPGSKTNRRWEGELNIAQSQSHKEVAIELNTPFINASGSLTKDEGSYQAKVEAHSGSDQLISANGTVEVDLSGVKKRCQASVTASYMGSEPLTVESSYIAVEGSRDGDISKQSIGMKVMAGSKTIKIKGTTKQEESSQGKYASSAEVSAISENVNIKIKGTLSNSKQAKSASIGIDYQKPGERKQSISWSGTTQTSSENKKTKREANFEMTQYPAANWRLSWGSQRDGVLLNNSFLLSYGKDQEKNYVRITQASHAPHPGRGEHTASLIIPQRDIYYNISTKYHIEKHETGAIPRAHLEFNYQSNRDTRVKGYIGVTEQSQRQLNATAKFSIDHNGRQRNYEGEIIEGRDNINAKSRYQNEKGELSEWISSYKRLSDDSKIHHEVESTLHTPSSPSPFKSKVSLRMDNEALDFAGNIGHIYSVKAYSSPVVTHANLELDSLKADLKFNHEVSRKNISIDVRIQGEHSKRVVGSLAVEKSEKKSEFNSTLRFYIDNEMKSKALLYTGVEILKPGKSHRSLSKLQIQDVIDISLSKKRDDSSTLINFRCDGNGWNPITAEIKTIRDKETANISMDLEIQDEEVAKVQVDAVWKQNTKKHEVSVNASVNSPYPLLNNIVMDFTQKITLQRHSKTKELLLYFKKDQTAFKAEVNSDFQPNGLVLRTAAETSYENSKKHSLGFAVQLDPEGISSSMDIEAHNRKEVSVAFKIQKKKQGLGANLTAKTPFEGLEVIEIAGTAEDRRGKKSIELHADVNKERVVHITGKIESSSRRTEVDGMVNISNLPFFEDKRYSVEILRTESTFKVLGNVQHENQRKLTFSSEVKKDANAVSLEAILDAPYKNFKGGKIRVSIENQSTTMKLKSRIDVGGEPKVDAEISVAHSQSVSEIKGRLETARNPEISVSGKCKRTKESLEISANLVKGKSSLFSSTFNRFSDSRGVRISLKTRSFNRTIIDTEISKDKLKNNSEKISFKVNGEFPAVSATFSTNYNDPSSMITEAGVCQEGQKTVCYSLKSSHENVLSSDIDGFNQRLIMDFKKSVRGSHTEALGSLEVVLMKDKNDLESKIIFQSDNQTTGYHVKWHKRQNQDDRHYFVAHAFLPSRNSSLKFDYQHKPNKLKMEFEAIPDVENPTSKFAIGMMGDVNRESKKISASIKAKLPARDEPFLLTCKWQKVDDKSDKVNMLLHYSTNKGKTLMLEIEPISNTKLHGMAYKLYTEDKNYFNARLNMIKHHNRDECKFGYQWQYTSRGITKEGVFMAELYHKKSEIFKRMSIKYESPSHNYILQGRISRTLGNASLSFHSSGQKIKEISVETYNSCMRMKVHHSDPPVNGSLCFNKQDGNTLQMVTADIYCHQQKCLDVSISVDPSQPEFISVSGKWENKKLLESLRKASGYDDILKGRSLRSVVREFKDKLDRVGREIERKTKEKLRLVIQKIVEETSRKFNSKWYSDELEEHFRATTRIGKSFIKFIIDLIPIDYIVKEVIKPLHDTTICFFHEYAKMVWEHVPQFIHLVMDATKDQFERCLKKFCVQGTFCYDFFQNYNQNGVLAVEGYIYDLYSKVIDFLKSKMPFPMKLPTIVDVLNLIHSQIINMKKEIEKTFGKFMGDMVMSKIGEFVKQLEKRIRQKIDFLLDDLIKKLDFVLDNLIKKFNDLINHFKLKIENFIDRLIDSFNNIFSGDEDYKIAKSLASDAKRKIVDVWRNKEEITKRSLQAVKDDIKENAKKLIREQIQVEKFDLKEGVVKFSFRQPLGATEVQILKNELRTINRKLDEYLNN